MTLSIRFTSAVPIVGNDSTTDLGIPPSLAERVRVSVPLFSTNSLIFDKFQHVVFADIHIS